MNIPSAPSEPLRTALDSMLKQAQPPAPLRAHVLRKYARRRLAVGAAPWVAVVVIASMVLIGIDRDESAYADWQAQSTALEASWRATGDREWLLSDARAQPLLYRLRRVDSALAQLHAAGKSTDADALAQLWRERSETLSALIETRRQGGVAIQL